MTVYAQDEGAVPWSAFVDVYVKVTDVNDNVPQSMRPVYYPEVMENSEKDTSVILVQASDEDHPESNRLKFEITGGNPQGFFVIDPFTGQSTFLVFFFLCLP